MPLSWIHCVLSSAIAAASTFPANFAPLLRYLLLLPQEDKISMNEKHCNTLQVGIEVDFNIFA